MGIVSSNPNASTSLVSGIGGGSLVIWIASLFGAHLSTYAGVAIAGAVSAVILFVGRNGYQGILNRLRYGSNGKPVSPPAPPAPTTGGTP